VNHCKENRLERIREGYCWRGGEKEGRKEICLLRTPAFLASLKIRVAKLWMIKKRHSGKEGNIISGRRSSITF
jgi:uncharacterized protein (DUF2237 family)